jgi:vacuolar-type H+-ATPase subunit F/Vma7
MAEGKEKSRDHLIAVIADEVRRRAPLVAPVGRGAWRGEGEVKGGVARRRRWRDSCWRASDTAMGAGQTITLSRSVRGPSWRGLWTVRGVWWGGECGEGGEGCAGSKATEIQGKFTALVERGDVGVIVITQSIADEIRATLLRHKAPVPVIIEIPDRETPYNPASDPVMKRVMQLLRSTGE